jgi:hypothetical protein
MPQRLGLDLTGALAGDTKGHAYLFKGAAATVG